MIPIPGLSTLLSSTTTSISDLTYWAIPLLILVIGLAVAGVILKAVKGGIMRGVGKVSGGKRRGRRGRR